MADKIDRFLGHIIMSGSFDEARKHCNVTEKDLKDWYREHRFFLYAIEAVLGRHAENERNRLCTKAAREWQ